jgi:cytidyltransferase-like protein
VIGLVVGKFHPLHKGHLELFQNALKYCDKLVVVVFSQDDYKVEVVDERIQVIRDTFPDIKQPEFKSSRGISRIYANYLKQTYTFDILLGNEQYVKYMAEWIGCKYKIIGSNFRWHAIDIKKDIWNKFQFIADNVKPVYSLTLCLIGTGSTYKTTLSVKLHQHFKQSMLIPEHGKDFVQFSLSSDISRLKASHFDTIIEEHCNLIKKSMWKSPLLILDTDFLTSKFWCLKYFGQFNDTLNSFQIKPDIYVLCGQEGAEYTKDFCNDYENHKPEEEIELYDFYHNHTDRPIYYIDGNFKERLRSIQKIIMLELNKKIGLI